MLLSDYLKIGYGLEEYGVFDPVLDEDSHFFINLQRLKKTTIPEFINSYEKIRDYFRTIIKLLDQAKNRDISDVFYKQALVRFKFSEVNGIGLGFAKGKSGAGFGRELASRVISTAYEIVKAGVKDPEFFELLPLFQENVGPDRLSDMIATLILDDISEYTQRINKELKINQECYADKTFVDGFLINPYKGDKVLLIPVDILHELPVAESWENIDYVATQNEIIRAEMNADVASEWQKYSACDRKAYMKRMIFENHDAFSRVLEGYQAEELEVFDPCANFRYYLEKLMQRIERLNLSWNTSVKEPNSFTVSLDILHLFKQWVENNKGWEVIHEADSQKREKIVQRVIHGIALAYIAANNLDISCEADEGRGPVDFKISFGGDKTIIEAKLSTNSQYLHGYEVQIEEYGKAEQTDQLIYVLIDLGNPGRVKKVQELHDRRYNDGDNPPRLIVIDSNRRQSASRA